MKYINKLSLVILLFVTIAQGCKKDENLNYFEGGTASVLSTTLANNSALLLSNATKDDVLFDLSWTNPNYKFTTGISSQNVQYSIEIDSAGKNFNSSKKKVITPDPTYTLKRSVKVGEMN
ncbi:MAG: SusE domain-containing protein, partial [Bacteroidetes bacterium]|nr:SusE domain-containing protein [Bacteroidota bacterium]